MADSIKIMVRVRPFNERELTNNFKNIIQMEGQEVRLKNPENLSEEPRKFGFHRCYYSTNDEMGYPPVQNKDVFNDIGMEILQCIYQGYNSTVFAYGQTGAGKSYSIEGKEDEKGILQMCLEDIFIRKKEENSKKGLATSVKVTYLEIYNEKLRDLVNPVERDIRVAQVGTSITITNVDPFPVSSYEDVQKVFLEGKKIRVVGGHAMNKNSSRSHAIFTIHYKETGKGKMIDAKFNIVDLAGSERQSKTGASGKRLQEANNINKSLTNLGIVIEKLAYNCQSKKNEYVPYRNSLLTHILSESLAGNSKTFMIAAISPADDNYEQTLGTLRFAQRASLISTKSKKNVSAKEGYNKELLEEIERLKQQLENAKNQGGSHSHSVSVQYITIEGQAAQVDGNIAQLMQELEQHNKEKASIEERLKQLEAEKAALEKEKAEKGLDEAKEARLKEVIDQIKRLKGQLEILLKTRDQLQDDLKVQKNQRSKLEEEIKKARGEVGAEQTKAAELNARIMLMMMEFEQNKTDKEELMRELEAERKMKEEIEANRKKILEEAGLSQQNTNINERKLPYIMNISEDPTLLGMLLYDLKDGETKIGTKDAEENHVKLNVLGIMTRHCSIFNDKGKIFVEPNQDAKVFVNGVIINKRKEINHLDRITLGHANNFKLIIPGKGSADDLRMSMATSGTYGEYIDDKLAANTIEAKSMKTFLVQLQHRLDKLLFAKFIEKFKRLLQDIDEMNEYTFHRYRKFPLKNKNVAFKLNVLVDIENYMKGVPEMVVICEHKDSKQVLFIWNEVKFQKRLEDMESWYEGAEKDQGQNSYYEFDPWFQADDNFIQEKAKLENMKAKEIVEMWNSRQQQNADYYKKILNEQKLILGELKSLGYSDNDVQNYADFYFRNFPPADSAKNTLQKMRKNEEVHKRIQRFMESCAEVQKCNMDNKFYNEQKDKYARNRDAANAPPAKPGSATNIPAPPAPSGGSEEGLAQENLWLNAKIEELQQELKKRAQIINKLKKG